MTSHVYINSQGLSKRANKRLKLGNQRTPLYRKEPEAVFRAGLSYRNSQNLSTMVSQTVLGWNRAHLRNHGSLPDHCCLLRSVSLACCCFY